MRKRWNLYKRKRGGIEGLPLMLLIMVVITAVALAIIIAWFSMLKPPITIKEVRCVPDSITLDDTWTDPDSGLTYAILSNPVIIKVTVIGSDGTTIRGAGVTLTGCGIVAHNSTKPGVGGAVYAQFMLPPPGQRLKVPVNDPTGDITVKASYSGMEGGATITVLNPFAQQ